MKCSDLSILLKVDSVYSVQSAFFFYLLCSQPGVLCGIALLWRLKEIINLCHGEWFPHFAEPKAQSHSVTRSVGSDRPLVPWDNPCCLGLLLGTAEGMNMCRCSMSAQMLLSQLRENRKMIWSQGKCRRTWLLLDILPPPWSLSQRQNENTNKMGYCGQTSFS